MLNCLEPVAYKMSPEAWSTDCVERAELESPSPRRRRRKRKRYSVTDEQLLLRYRETGDRALFAQLVRRYESELFSYLRRYLGNAEMAEDAFQGAFLQVHLKQEQFEEGRRFRPWLYAIATNQAIDAQRRNKRHRMVSLDRTGGDGDNDNARLGDLLAGNDLDPEGAACKAEDARWIQEAMEALPESMRDAVHLVYFQGLKYREAAEALSIPVGTVKSRIHTAILKLNESYRETRVG